MLLYLLEHTLTAKTDSTSLLKTMNLHYICIHSTPEVTCAEIFYAIKINQGPKDYNCDGWSIESVAITWTPNHDNHSSFMRTGSRASIKHMIRDISTYIGVPTNLKKN